MSPSALSRALTDPGEPRPATLPAQVSELLQSLDAPPPLAAHLRLVHDAAARLTSALARRYESLAGQADQRLAFQAAYPVGVVGGRR